jgi:hypothetical protein
MTPTTSTAGEGPLPGSGLSAEGPQGPQSGDGPGAGSPGEAAALRVRAGQLRAEADRVRRTGDRLSLALWGVAAMALMFTMANVTTFAVEHDTPWWIGWLLDPMASLALLVVLIGDGVLARHGLRSGGWARLLKHGSALATWSMNAWTSVVAQDAAGIVLHSVPPALVIGLSEATPTYRAKFAELAEKLQGQAFELQARADQLDARQSHPQSAPVQASAVGADPAGTDRTLDRTLDRTPTRIPVEGSGVRTVAEESGGPSDEQSGEGSGERSGVRTVAEESGEESAEGSGVRTVARTRTVKPTTERTAERLVGEGSGSGRRSEEELLGLVRAAIAEGRLPARPSGTAIQRELGGGKGPAMRVAARLAAPQDADGDVHQDDAAVIQLVHDRAEAAS